MEPTSKTAILYLENINVSFDGFKALNDLSLSIRPGEMRAIIGPNGAGKTTMMDVITGKTRPDSGRVLFNDIHNLARMDETDIATLGIGRKFQKPTVFENHTVNDNLLLALSDGRGVWDTLFANVGSREAERIDEILQIIRLTKVQAEYAASLSHGQKQWLEIGMLLAQKPKLLLVDEPVAGMTDSETAETARLLKEISQQHSLVVVEHDMDFVRDLDVDVTVLHEGAAIAEGSLDYVSKSDRVIEVYLGR